MLDLIAMFLTQLAGLMTNGLLMVFTLVFILIESADLPHKLKAVLPDPERSFPHVREFERTFRHYIAIKIWISLATGIAATVLLIIVGVSYPVLWGVVAFLFNFIPNIGSILDALPPVLLALIQLGLGPFPGGSVRGQE